MVNGVIKIEFSKKQYFTLMKAAFLANWLANAYRDDDLREEYEAMEDYVFSFAEDFGYGRFVDHEPQDGDKYYPTGRFEEEAATDDLIDEYDNGTFWNGLTERLAERDLVRKHGVKGAADMEEEERWKELDELEEFYAEEFEKNELNNIALIKLRLKSE